MLVTGEMLGERAGSESTDGEGGECVGTGQMAGREGDKGPLPAPPPTRLDHTQQPAEVSPPGKTPATHCKAVVLSGVRSDPEVWDSKEGSNLSFASNRTQARRPLPELGSPTSRTLQSLVWSHVYYDYMYKISK